MVRDSVLGSVEVQLAHRAAEAPIHGPIMLRKRRRPGDERGPDAPSPISRGTECPEPLGARATDG